MAPTLLSVPSWSRRSTRLAPIAIAAGARLRARAFVHARLVLLHGDQGPRHLKTRDVDLMDRLGALKPVAYIGSSHLVLPSVDGNPFDRQVRARRYLPPKERSSDGGGQDEESHRCVLIFFFKFNPGEFLLAISRNTVRAQSFAKFIQLFLFIDEGGLF